MQCPLPTAHYIFAQHNRMVLYFGLCLTFNLTTFYYGLDPVAHTLNTSFEVSIIWYGSGLPVNKKKTEKKWIIVWFLLYCVLYRTLHQLRCQSYGTVTYRHMRFIKGKLTIAFRWWISGMTSITPGKFCDHRRPNHSSIGTECSQVKTRPCQNAHKTSILRSIRKIRWSLSAMIGDNDNPSPDFNTNSAYPTNPIKPHHYSKLLLHVPKDQHTSSIQPPAVDCQGNKDPK